MPKCVKFDESCTGAVQSLLRGEKMSDKSVEVLKMKLKRCTSQNFEKNSKKSFLIDTRKAQDFR